MSSSIDVDEGMLLTLNPVTTLVKARPSGLHMVKICSENRSKWWWDRLAGRRDWFDASSLHGRPTNASQEDPPGRHTVGET